MMKGLASNSKSEWGRAGENWKIITTRVTGCQPGTAASRLLAGKDQEAAAGLELALEQRASTVGSR